MKRATYAFALLAVVGALVIAGCGGGSSSSSAGSTGGEGGTELTSAHTGTVSGAEVSGLGTVLVESKGMTVYEFTPDEGTTSVCYGECEAIWPPVVASGKLSAGEGAMSADLGTTKRKDGTKQVTYKGHPLYTFAGDKAPGEANGNEVEGTWFALDEGGSAVKGSASAGEAEPKESEGSSGGGTYGY